MITLDVVKKYLRIDYEDEDTYINTLIDTSLIYIDSMVGIEYQAYPDAVKLAEVLQLRLIGDMYEQRSTDIQNNTGIDRISNSILDKLSNY